MNTNSAANAQLTLLQVLLLILLAVLSFTTSHEAAGAEPYKRDLENLEYQLLDTGHFALETHVDEIADHMRSFLRREVLQTSLAAD